MSPSKNNYPAPVEDDYIIPNFRFRSGAVLPDLQIHYRTIGTPSRDDMGVVRNAVLIMHGTGGSGSRFLTDDFGGVLFGPDQPLDAGKYFIILPDAIGHGQSSKPSGGMRARFPNYRYMDLVTAQHLLITEKLQVEHLRLAMGTSMGGMHTWIWGARYPDFMDALMPMASLPVAIAGRNRMIRRMISDAIRQDPDWMDGEYKIQPRGLITAIYAFIFMVSCPLQWQKQAPTQKQADELFDTLVGDYLDTLDANDLLYQIEASSDYDPAPFLENIRAPLLAINSEDDQVNPPELGIMEEAIGRVRGGRYTLIPTSKRTRGHRTYAFADIWSHHLNALLKSL